jgi:hypothetical protein
MYEKFSDRLCHLLRLAHIKSYPQKIQKTKKNAARPGPSGVKHPINRLVPAQNCLSRRDGQSVTRFL